MAQRPHLDHAVRHHEVDPGRDLDVDLVAGDRHHAGAGHVPEHQAAVVGRAEIAGRLGGDVGRRQDLTTKDLRRLAAAEAAAVGDLDDHLVLDDHERVRAGDDGVGRVDRALRDRLDGPPDDRQRGERSDGVMDDDDVVVVRIQAHQTIASALIARRATGHGPSRHRQRASASAASVSVSQSGCATTTRLSRPAAAIARRLRTG